MCRKIRGNEESYKVLGFWMYLNKALTVPFCSHTIEPRFLLVIIFGTSATDAANIYLPVMTRVRGGGSLLTLFLH